ncbi:hypothetical protein DYBT9275_01051 [Dyadobacter sp. CECT 9275]|uniref:DUF3820 family protein n=1 Tax=Dyadobacter helix TaxID=2822344 RepID=A0A916J9K3_9BACT|nr:DUF3820 family protein [Dyadobacter sp. CECT 9275]CAG4992839.1 hypothetical protein DYBT9275_01051 [Dyadobacter sp. CECT 9275]
MKDLSQPDPEMLKELIVYRMPFGKYKDWLITDLPVSYLEWFDNKGFPAGKLGMMLSTMYQIRLNDLMFLIDGLKRIYRK